MLPDMSGWLVLTSLKKDPATAHIPVIMISVLDDKQTGVTLGASEYLTKPLDRGKLLSFLQQVGAGPVPGVVLVVDDDASARDMLRRAIEKEGWAVMDAGNGIQALEQVASVLPDLILLDLGMLRHLRANPKSSRVPVVVLTGQDMSVTDRVRLAGFVEHVVQKRGGDLNALSELTALILRSARPADTGAEPSNA